MECDMKEIFTYKNNNEWVSYIEEGGIVYMSAHTDSRYSFGMLKAIKETFEMHKEVITQLKHDYLVQFYSRHADLTLVDEANHIYLVRRKHGS